MALSSEDQFRLHVLLANDLQAIRIDESSMTVYGLSEEGESSVPLNPNCRDDIYLRRVRELISTQVLGSPGGYPVYLRRWTRMGQTRDTNLEKLLLLGEPEAVVAVVNASSLTEELARRAWWAMPSADNAREMLRREMVARSPLGRELADYLVEFLPFETDHLAMIESIRLVVGNDLVDEAGLESLWGRAKHKNSYYVGFLQAKPDGLPGGEPHPEHARLREAFGGLLERNPCARQLDRILDAPGQAYLATAELAMRKPNNQDVVVALMDALRDYFSCVCVNPERPHDEIDEIERRARAVIEGEGGADCPGELTEGVRELLAAAPWAEPLVEAMLVLSGIGVRVVTPIFSRTDAIGSVMRRKLEPVIRPIEAHMARLRRPVADG